MVQRGKRFGRKNIDNLDIGDERVPASENDANTAATILFVLKCRLFH